MSRAQLTSTVEQNTGGAVSPYVAGKNKIINGDFSFFQRGVTIAVSNNNYSYYTADRWNLTNGAVSGNAWTINQVATGDTTNLPNIRYAVRVQRNLGQTSGSGSYFAQFFESSTSIPLAGKVVTLSFYARAGSNYSPTSNQFSSIIYTGTGIDQNPVTGSYTGQVNTQSNFTLTTTWQRFTTTMTMPSNMTEIAVNFLAPSVGTAGANDYYELTGVQLEAGPVATPFTTATGTLSGELQACQRYYWRDNTTTVSTNGHPCFGVAQSTTSGYFYMPFPVTMRIAPTSMNYSNVRPVQYGVAAYALSGMALSTTETSPSVGVFYTSGSTGMIANVPLFLYGAGSGNWIEFSAEL